ncbi:MAG: hypothetical protein EXQ63_08690 [Ilumatobacteraceae bacterium]|nr:hypothetical protein [Ilumatobacteraceae bacterium]
MVTVKDALDDFRARVTTTLMAKSPAAVPRVPHAIPPIGVYTYKTVGHESLDGPLNESHDYPAESAITITASDCGFDWRWEVFERRSDTNTWCWTNSSLTESQSTTDHIFFNVHDKRTFVCQPVAVVLPSDPAATSSSTCAGSDTVNAHTAQVVGTESLRVGNDTVETLIVTATDVTGKKSSGTSVVTLWLRPSDGLIVKMHRVADIKNNSIIGAIRYTEDITLTLSSLTPQM